MVTHVGKWPRAGHSPWVSRRPQGHSYLLFKRDVDSNELEHLGAHHLALVEEHFLVSYAPH